MKLNKVFIFVACLSLVACYVQGELDQSGKDKLMSCKDARDGETFAYNTNTITDVRIGIGAPTTFQITTTTGKHMTLNSNMDTYIKCTEVTKKAVK